MNIDTKKVKERALLAQISHAKDELLNPDEMEMNAGADFNQKRAAQVYREYQAALRRNNALDFDDLIVKTVELFQNCDDVLQTYQERFRYIMVDEYQDTNTAQFKFVSLLASRYENLFTSSAEPISATFWDSREYFRMQKSSALSRIIVPHRIFLMRQTV